MEINKVYVGNNLDILKTFPDNSIDSIVTDPPYGLGKEPNATELLRDWLDTGYHEVKGKGFMGKEWDAFVPQPIFWKECYRVLKHGGHVLSFAGTRTYDWMVLGLRLAGFEIRDQLAWIYGSGFPKSLDVAKAIEGKLVHGSSNTQAFHKLDGDEVESKLGFTKNQHEHGARPKDYTNRHKSKTNIKYTTDQAKEWQGWGTALKPALEPIVMARKPLDGTVADNVLKHGVGGINIDGCRVGLNGEQLPTGSGNPSNGATWSMNGNGGNETNPLGRFPANVIHDGSDEVVALFPSDGEDSSARFFYTAKASQSERNYGLDGFDDGLLNDGRKAVSDRPYLRNQTQRKNIHPTVKPIDLMRYLVRLVTPKGGVCLDPFLGSGTTAVACKAEKFDYIGIELSPEYAEIAKARIKAEVVQYDIFDVLEDYDD